jgi:hypothetical protein
MIPGVGGELRSCTPWKKPVAPEDRLRDLHELAIRMASFRSEHLEGLPLVDGMAFLRMPLARSVTARRENAPSRLWYSANRRSTMSIELSSSRGSSTLAM